MLQTAGLVGQDPAARTLESMRLSTLIYVNRGENVDGGEAPGLFPSRHPGQNPVELVSFHSPQGPHRLGRPFWALVCGPPISKRDQPWLRGPQQCTEC